MLCRSIRRGGGGGLMAVIRVVGSIGDWFNAGDLRSLARRQA
jgi:hypothetical protein